MPMGATLFSLIYDAKVVIPLDLEIPSFCISLKYFILDEESLRIGWTNLLYLMRDVSIVGMYNALL